MLYTWYPYVLATARSQYVDDMHFVRPDLTSVCGSACLEFSVGLGRW
jgi:hypothetical protein